MKTSNVSFMRRQITIKRTFRDKIDKKGPNLERKRAEKSPKK